MKNLRFEPDGFALEISGVQWLLRDFDGHVQDVLFSVGLLPTGELLALECYSGEGLLACRFRNFPDMVKGDAIGCGDSSFELTHCVLREVAHKLGIAEIEGHPVDHWLRDEEEIYAEMEAKAKRAQAGPRIVS